MGIVTTPIDIEDLRDAISNGIYADDRQTSHELQISLDALKALADYAQALEIEVKGLQEDVNHWHVKAEAYGGIVFNCSPALEAAGHPVDASGPDGAVGGIRRAVGALVAERDELAVWVKTGDLKGLLYKARTALHAATPNVSPEGAPVSDGWRVLWLCEHVKKMEHRLDDAHSEIEALLPQERPV